MGFDMSNQKLTIRYAGHELPPLQGLRIELQPIDVAERNASGDMMLEEVAHKRKVVAIFPPQNGSKVSAIMSTLKSNRSGLLEYYDPVSGDMVTMPAYYGAGPSIEMKRYDSNMGLQLYSAITINFIEM